MTTAIAPTERSEIDVRWEMVMYGRPTRFRDAHANGVALAPTRRFYRVERALQDIAASLVDDGVWDEEMQDGDDSLEKLTGETWDAIEKLMKDWASRADQRRDIIRAQWRADDAAKAIAS